MRSCRRRNAIESAPRRRRRGRARRRWPGRVRRGRDRAAGTAGTAGTAGRGRGMTKVGGGSDPRVWLSARAARRGRSARFWRGRGRRPWRSPRRGVRRRREGCRHREPLEGAESLARRSGSPRRRESGDDHAGEDSQKSTRVLLGERRARIARAPHRLNTSQQRHRPHRTAAVPPPSSPPANQPTSKSGSRRDSPSSRPVSLPCRLTFALNANLRRLTYAASAVSSSSILGAR